MIKPPSKPPALKPAEGPIVIEYDHANNLVRERGTGRIIEGVTSLILNIAVGEYPRLTMEVILFPPKG